MGFATHTSAPSDDFRQIGESYNWVTTSRAKPKIAAGMPLLSPSTEMVEWLCVKSTSRRTMSLRIIITILSLGLFIAWPTTAMPPYTAIIIDSGSPYFVPKSATVASGSPIRWENPTATEHTITHSDCLKDATACAFDSGLVLPNGSFTVPGLVPGRYPYLCRIHPIMHGIIIVTDPVVPSQL